MQTYTEHEQDDPDFGQLARKIWIGDEPRSMGSHKNSRKQVTNYRRQFEPMTDKAEDQCRKKPYGENLDYFQLVHVTPMSAMIQIR